MNMYYKTVEMKNEAAEIIHEYAGLWDSYFQDDFSYEMLVDEVCDHLNILGLEDDDIIELKEWVSLIVDDEIGDGPSNENREYWRED